MVASTNQISSLLRKNVNFFGYATICLVLAAMLTSVAADSDGVRRRLCHMLICGDDARCDCFPHKAPKDMEKRLKNEIVRLRRNRGGMKKCYENEIEEKIERYTDDLETLSAFRLRSARKAQNKNRRNNRLPVCTRCDDRKIIRCPKCDEMGSKEYPSPSDCRCDPSSPCDCSRKAQHPSEDRRARKRREKCREKRHEKRREKRGKKRRETRRGKHRE